MNPSPARARERTRDLRPRARAPPRFARRVDAPSLRPSSEYAPAAGAALACAWPSEYPSLSMLSFAIKSLRESDGAA